ncbi:MAG TPA: rod shape-determining protein MreC [Candidatus Polarisedimenticolaceae bacterium]
MAASQANPTRSNAVLLVVVLFAQLLLMAGSLRREDAADAVEDGVRTASGPVLGAARTVGGSVVAALRMFGDVGRSRKELAAMRGEIATLSAEVDRRQEQALENDRLRRLLGMRERLAPRSVGAEVIAASLTGQSRVVVVGVGTEAGIRVDLPAVAWGGAVGRVVAAGSGYAKIRLLTDPSSGVSGVVQRSRVEGVLRGRADGLFEMQYVPKYADVAVGDAVVTSGLDGVFPKGFTIGRVARVQETTGASMRIEVLPEIDYGEIEEVLILLEKTGSETLEAGAPAEPAR